MIAGRSFVLTDACPSAARVWAVPRRAVAERQSSLPTAVRAAGSARSSPKWQNHDFPNRFSSLLGQIGWGKPDPAWTRRSLAECRFEHALGDRSGEAAARRRRDLGLGLEHDC